MLKSNLTNLVVSIILGLIAYYTISVGTFFMIILIGIFYLGISTFRNTEVMEERKEEERIDFTKSQETFNQSIIDAKEKMLQMTKQA